MNASFYMPTRVLFGRGILAQNKHAICIGHHALIVTGQKSAKLCGALDDVTAVLSAAGISYTVFDKISENPPLLTCYEGGKIGAAAKADFLLTRAEAYPVPEDVNRCYFFNPFSVEILHKVMARILESYYENPRELFLFFYYPSDEYVAYLMGVDELEFYDEIECDDLFAGNDPRERILIFQLPDYCA